jgi:hypothetical protein
VRHPAWLGFGVLLAIMLQVAAQGPRVYTGAVGACYLQVTQDFGERYWFLVAHRGAAEMRQVAWHE